MPQQRVRTALPSILRGNFFSDFSAIYFCSECQTRIHKKLISRGRPTNNSWIGWLRLKLQKKNRCFTPGRSYSRKGNWKTLVNLRFPNRNDPFSRSAKFRKSNISYPLIRMGACAYHGLRNVSLPESFAYVVNECQFFGKILRRY